MKKIWLIILSINLISCAMDTGNKDSYVFMPGWYRFDDGNTVAYLEYNGREELSSAGTETEAYPYSYMDIARDTYVFSKVKDYLTYTEDELSLPQWCYGIPNIFGVDEKNILKGLSCSEKVIRKDIPYYNVAELTITEPGQSVSFETFFYKDDGTVFRTYEKPCLTAIVRKPVEENGVIGSPTDIDLTDDFNRYIKASNGTGCNFINNRDDNQLYNRMEFRCVKMPEEEKKFCIAFENAGRRDTKGGFHFVIILKKPE